MRQPTNNSLSTFSAYHGFCDGCPFLTSLCIYSIRNHLRGGNYSGYISLVIMASIILLSWDWKAFDQIGKDATNQLWNKQNMMKHILKKNVLFVFQKNAIRRCFLNPKVDYLMELELQRYFHQYFDGIKGKLQTHLTLLLKTGKEIRWGFIW